MDYGKVLTIGFTGIIKQVIEAMDKLDTSDPEYIKKKNFYEALVITYTAAINFAHRYAAKAREMAASCPDPVRKAELLQIAANCDRVPERGRPISTRHARHSGLFRFSFRLKPTDILFHQDVLTSTCIRIWRQTRIFPRNLHRNW